jgi:hypothetical protein
MIFIIAILSFVVGFLSACVYIIYKADKINDDGNVGGGSGW